jgi:hypothetical protein
MSKLCDCAVCGHPVPARPYQAPTARTCSPTCAKRLALREHPADAEPVARRGGGHSDYWRKQLEKERLANLTPIGEKPS